MKHPDPSCLQIAWIPGSALPGASSKRSRLAQPTNLSLRREAHMAHCFGRFKALGANMVVPGFDR